MEILKQCKSQYSSNSDFILNSNPKAIDELDHVVRKAMMSGRILNIKSNRHGDKVPEYAHKVFEWIHELSVKYRPWQFRTLTQLDGSWEVNWVEVDERLYKYGAISKFREEW